MKKLKGEVGQGPFGSSAGALPSGIVSKMSHTSILIVPA